MTKPTNPGTSPLPAPSRPLKKTLAACTATVAAAASLHCASTPTGQMEHPRRNEPCEPEPVRAMTEVLKAYRGELWNGKFPLESALQVSFHHDYDSERWLDGGLKPGPIVSIVRNPDAFPLGTYLYGWVWVDGDVAEIQYTEAQIPGDRRRQVPICARVGTLDRRTVLTKKGSTPDAPRFSRSDYFLVVDRW